MARSVAAPSQAGVDAAGVEAFLDAAAHLDLHSIHLARQGTLIAQGHWHPYTAEQVNLVYSVSKSITASTVAILVGDGVLALEDRVLDHVSGLAEMPDDVDPRWHDLTLEHCLTMTVGHTAEAWPQPRHVRTGLLTTILQNPPDQPPGSVFAYNQVATYLLSRVVEAATGTSLSQVAWERLLRPLGATALDWDVDGDGHVLGFSGARIRTADLSTLTQLWLDRGAHEGQQLIPSAWFDRATRPYLPVPPGSDSDWEQGYGHSFWVARHGYRADGAYGQYGVVLPEQRLALTVTSELVDLHELLDLAWTHLLPALDRPGSDAADEALAARLRTLAIPPVAGDGGATGSAAGGSWRVVESDLSPEYSDVAVDGDLRELILTRADEPLRIALGHDAWARSEIRSPAGVALALAASAAWTSDGLTAQIRVIETPHSISVTTTPDGARLAWRLPPLGGPDPFHLAAPVRHR